MAKNGSFLAKAIFKPRASRITNLMPWIRGSSRSSLNTINKMKIDLVDKEP